MRPLFIALIAAALPAVSYARPAPPATPVRETAPAKAETAKPADASIAAVKPNLPPADQKFDAPLCASPSVSIENPAGTQNGLACKTVMWAGGDTANLSQG
jgi:hypothetical protein